MTIEGLSEKFNKEYWNYAKLISGVLRWRMPIEQVIKLVGSLQLDSENINTWKEWCRACAEKICAGRNRSQRQEVPQLRKRDISLSGRLPHLYHLRCIQMWINLAK